MPRQFNGLEQEPSKPQIRVRFPVAVPIQGISSAGQSACLTSRRSTVRSRYPLPNSLVGNRVWVRVPPSRSRGDQSAGAGRHEPLKKEMPKSRGVERQVFGHQSPVLDINEPAQLYRGGRVDDRAGPENQMSEESGTRVRIPSSVPIETMNSLH